MSWHVIFIWRPAALTTSDHPLRPMLVSMDRTPRDVSLEQPAAATVVGT